MSLVDEHGRPVSTEQLKVCQECGSRSMMDIMGFGSKYERVCTDCGVVVAVGTTGDVSWLK